MSFNIKKRIKKKNEKSSKAIPNVNMRKKKSPPPVVLDNSEDDEKTKTEPGSVLDVQTQVGNQIIRTKCPATLINDELHINEDLCKSEVIGTISQIQMKDDD